MAEIDRDDDYDDKATHCIKEAFKVMSLEELMELRNCIDQELLNKVIARAINNSSKFGKEN